MAKKPTNLTKFFDAKRRECFLKGVDISRSGDGFDVKLNVSMPLLNRPADAMPEEITKTYLLLAEEDSTLIDPKQAIIVENASVSVFVTDVVKKPLFVREAATIKAFHFDAGGKDEKRHVDLVFQVCVRMTDQVKDWIFETLDRTFFMEVKPDQMELSDQVATTSKKSEQQELTIQ